MTLSAQHHGELNGKKVKRGRYDELRKVYTDDPEALQWIEMYDPDSSYNDHLRTYIHAFKTGDEETERKEKLWFQEHGFDNL